MGVKSRLETDGINQFWITEKFGGVGCCDRLTKLLPWGSRLNESLQLLKEVRVRGCSWKKIRRLRGRRGEEWFALCERSNNARLVGKMKVASVLEKMLLIWMQEVIYSPRFEQSLLHIYCHFQLKVDNRGDGFSNWPKVEAHKFQSWTSLLVARPIDRRYLKRFDEICRLRLFDSA